MKKVCAVLFVLLLAVASFILIRIGPDLPGANQRWIATGAVRSFGGSDGHN
jgi:hypothetical protein